MTARRPPRDSRRRLVFGLLLAGVGVAGLLLAVLAENLRLAGIACAIVFFILAVSLLSSAARIAHQLSHLVGKSVEVEVWGHGLEGAVPLRVVAVRAIGAGLHFFLRTTNESKARDLKVAQPKSAEIQDTRLEIGEAAYISWAGRKLDRDASGETKALVLRWPAD